jgi:hypothetical protein
MQENPPSSCTNPTPVISPTPLRGAQAANTVLPTAEANCSTAGYVKEPATQKLSLVAVGTGGLIGGAAGGTAGRSMSPASNLSYGRAAAAGAGGGALGWIIVGAIANADVGKIYFPDSPQPDADFILKLRTLTAQKVILKAVPPSSRSAETPLDFGHRVLRHCAGSHRNLTLCGQEPAGSAMIAMVADIPSATQWNPRRSSASRTMPKLGRQFRSNGRAKGA